MESGEPHLAMLLDYPERAAARLTRGISRAGTPVPCEGRDGRRVHRSRQLCQGCAATRSYARRRRASDGSGHSDGHQRQATRRRNTASPRSRRIPRPRSTIPRPMPCSSRHGTTRMPCLPRTRLRPASTCSAKSRWRSTVDGTRSRHCRGARRAQGLLTVGFNRRFAPAAWQAKTPLAPRSGPLVMLYRVNAGAIPADSWIQRDEGGGRIVGEVCHFVDTLTYLCGGLPVEVQAVAAQGLPTRCRS